jgi:hypothetical protein
MSILVMCCSVAIIRCNSSLRSHFLARCRICKRSSSQNTRTAI